MALLQDMVLASDHVQEFLDGLVTVASAAFTSACGEVFCGVTLLRPRSMASVASSSEEARLMDEVQYGFDDGPCLRAAREGETIHIPDFLTESRFPQYREAIAGHGIRSALGIPIRLEAGASAGLDFYATEPYAFTSMSIAVAEGIARDASKSLRLAVRIATLNDKSEHMKTAMESRTVIDLAVGAIMGQNRCSQAEAIAILRTASQGRNTKLRDLAEDLLTSLGQTGTVSTHFD
ncbi:ANTAR domain-containing protein [Arthrobacter cheniae]|uniref:ANTAR domain-containing protein n=2 Tax=Arthrobacter cheniae TaxID=1258888 RepID=A0A3A5LWV8_9MICC|nr:ANTAR domain-containing protein [Arthrobacter cheniae]